MNPDSPRDSPRSAVAWVGALCAALLASAVGAQSEYPRGRQPRQHLPAPVQAGGHGTAAVDEAKHFPSIGYDDARGPRPAQKKRPPRAAGDPVVGKRLAHDENKGRCLSCHVLDRHGILPGDVGPNLSAYGNLGRDAAYTFQQVWDARVHNPLTAMPPFGTNELLSDAEVAHIAAYLQTLKQAVTEPPRPAARAARERVHVAGVDFSTADDYVDAGRVAFGQTGTNGRSCASCHSPQAREPVSIERAASRYPKLDGNSTDVIGLEEQVNVCRRQHMASDPLPLGSRNMNLLTGYVKYLGRANSIGLDTGTAAAAAFERGRASFSRKAGQLNFSCADCHEAAGGKWLRGQRLQRLDRTTGEWPKHFIATHDLGYISLRYRIQHCQIVVRTQPLPLHSREYRDIEYYLKRLASGGPVLAPTMTRLREE